MKNFGKLFAYGIYAISIALLVLVLIFGSHIKGATSWFTFGGFSFQPSELAKFGTCLAVSAFLGRFNTSLEDGRSRLIAFGLILAPIILILKQPDLGSALVFFSFLIVFYREGLSSSFYLLVAFILANLITGFVFPTHYISLALAISAGMILAYNIKNKKIYQWVLGGVGLAALGLVYWQSEAREDFGPLIAGHHWFFLNWFVLMCSKKTGENYSAR